LPQHFLLSPAARTLSLPDIMRMSDDAAHARFVAIRFATNNGEPFCSHCGNLKVYAPAESPRRWKCASCRKKFSVTSGTLFHGRKLPIREYLAIIGLFCNGVKGVAALRMARDTNINPKSAFRSAAQAAGGDAAIDADELEGEVEIDGELIQVGGSASPDRSERMTAHRSPFDMIGAEIWRHLETYILGSRMSAGRC